MGKYRSDAIEAHRDLGIDGGQFVVTNQGVTTRDPLDDSVTQGPPVAIQGNGIMTMARAHEYPSLNLLPDDRKMIWCPDDLYGPEPAINGQVGGYLIKAVERVSPDNEEAIVYKMLLRKS